MGVSESSGERAAVAGAYPGRRLLALRGRSEPVRQQGHSIGGADRLRSEAAGEKTYAVRTYSVLGTLGRIPELAAKHNVSVALGVQLSRDRAESEEEMRTGIALAKEHRNIVRVIVGNEVLLRGDLSGEELAAYLDRARASDPPAGGLCRHLGHLAQEPGDRAPRGLHRRAPVPLLGGRRRRVRRSTSASASSRRCRPRIRRSR